MSLGSETARHGKDSSVVVTEPEARGQHRRVGVVELHPQRPAVLPDRQGLVEAAVLDPQVVE